MIIQIPNSVKSDSEGYAFFCKVASETADVIISNIIFDFRNCRWFEANLCAILGAIIDDLMTRNIFCYIHNLNSSLIGVFSRNMFFKVFDEEINYPRNINTTTIYYEKFYSINEDKIKNYVTSELFDKSDMPLINEFIKKEIIKSIFEIFVNAITHGNCKYIYTCGQFYNRKKPAMVYFTFVDLGITIKNNVSNYLNKNISGVDSLLWAITEKNTTKTGNHSGGLGLKVVQEFISQNNGKIHIVSADGFWELNRNKQNSEFFFHEFPGTIVTLAFNLEKNDKYNYESLKVDVVF